MIVSAPKTPTVNSAGKAKLLILLLVLLGIGLRIYAAGGELWLDEIWNIEVVSKISSPLDVYLNPHNMDGHSSLFSCLLYFLPAGLPDIYYRLPSLLFSVSTLLVLSIYYPCNATERLITLALSTCSYILILYGTEARGYSGMIFFLLLAFSAWLRIKEKFSNRDGIIFAVSCIFGLLFHYSFLLWYPALILIDLGTSNLFGKKTASSNPLLKLHLLISTIIAVVYLTVIRRLPPGSGPRPHLLQSYIDILSITVGGPPIAPDHIDWLPVSLFLALGVLLAAFLVTTKVKDFSSPKNNDFIYPLAILIVPLSIALLTARDIVLPRYFLGSSVMATLLAGRLWTRLRAHRIKPAYSLILIAAVGANLHWTFDLIQHGRGNYHQVMSKITDQSEQLDLLVDHDFRHGMVLDYYFPKRYKIRDTETVLSERTAGNEKWLLTHQLGWSPPVVSSKELTGGALFTLVATAPSTMLSGWQLALYQRQNASPPSPPN